MSRELERSLAAPRRRLWWAAGVGLATGLALVAGVALLARDDAAVRADASRRPAPPPTGVFATGGAPPALDDRGRQAFGETLPDWVISLNDLAQASRDGAPTAYDAADVAMARARDDLLGPSVRDALGAGPVAQLERVLDLARAAAAAPPEREGPATDDLLEAVGSLNDALAAAGAPLFVDGDVMEGPRGSRIVLLYSFAVEHVRLFRAGGQTVRALQVRRLDRLNWTHRLLGFTSPHLREAVVLLDQVDELLVNYVLPAFVPDAPVALVDRRSEDSGARWQTAVSERAGQVIRADYSAADGFDGGGAANLGRLLTARRELFEGWDRALASRGASLREPRGLHVDGVAELRKSLAQLIPSEQLDELEAIEGAIADGGGDRVLGQVRAVLVASVERHELQHRIDAALPSPRRLPEALARYVGPLSDQHGEPRALARLARDELSAYLADLARDSLTPRVNLTLLSRFLLDQRRWGSAESYAALVIFEGLASQLAVASSTEPLLAAGQVDRARVASMYLALTDVPSAELRAAARAVWERAFDAPLPDVAATSSSSYDREPRGASSAPSVGASAAPASR